MKKIICPTDFSTTANNAIEYASQLAKAINTELEIVNVQLLSPASPVLSGIEASKYAAPASATLKKMCDDINQTFHIPCSYKVEITSDTLDEAIPAESAEDSLIVMGTNGMDDLYQYIFGTNTYHVIKKTKCPVLIIPEGVIYTTIKNITLPWDYKCNSKSVYFQLKNLFGVFNPEITFLHISKQKTPVSDSVFRALKEEVYSCIGKEENVLFARLYSESPKEFANSIDDYMSDNKTDLLAIAYYDRGKLKNIFHGTIVKELSETAQYPLLVSHVAI